MVRFGLGANSNLLLYCPETLDAAAQYAHLDHCSQKLRPDHSIGGIPALQHALAGTATK